MTKITYNIGKRVMVEISGHANSERNNGSDLCCAAESMLAYTLIDTIEKLNLPRHNICVSDGYVYISFDFVGLRSFSAVAAVKTVINGFELLSTKYPQNVLVKKVKEVTKNEQVFR